MRVLVDTCVIIDALAQREPFKESAQEIIRLGAENKHSFFISAKSFLDIHYVLKHYLHDETIVRKSLMDLSEAIEVCDLDETSVLFALNSSRRDYEDSVQIETALQQTADAIVTRNVKYFEDSPIPVLSPSEFIARIKGKEDN